MAAELRLIRGNEARLDTNDSWQERKHHLGSVGGGGASRRRPAASGVSTAPRLYVFRLIKNADAV